MRGTITVEGGGQKRKVTLIGCSSLNAVQTYAKKIESNSDGVCTAMSYSSSDYPSKTIPASVNIDVIGIVVAIDKRGVAHKISIPGIKKTCYEFVEGKGNRIKSTVVDEMAKAFATAIGESTLTGKYGYVIGKK